MKDLKALAASKAKQILDKVNINSCPYCKQRLEEIRFCTSVKHANGRMMELQKDGNFEVPSK